MFKRKKKTPPPLSSFLLSRLTWHSLVGRSLRHRSSAAVLRHVTRHSWPRSCNNDKQCITMLSHTHIDSTPLEYGLVCSLSSKSSLDNHQNIDHITRLIDKKITPPEKVVNGTSCTVASAVFLLVGGHWERACADEAASGAFIVVVASLTRQTLRSFKVISAILAIYSKE